MPVYETDDKFGQTNIIILKSWLILDVFLKQH